MEEAPIPAPTGPPRTTAAVRRRVPNAARDSTHWHFACRLAGDPAPRATSFYVGPWDNRILFKALANAIQQPFRDRRASDSIERILLTTCALGTTMESRHRGQQPATTPCFGRRRFAD